MSGFDREFQSVKDRAQDQGWKYQRTERGHHQFYAPDKKGIVTADSKFDSPRSFQNFMADMKRNGYEDDTLVRLADAMPASPEKWPVMD